METKKIYIAPSLEVITVLQECLLMDFSKTNTTSNTGNDDIGGPGISDFSKQHNGSMWEEYDDNDYKSFWD